MLFVPLVDRWPGLRRRSRCRTSTVSTRSATPTRRLLVTLAGSLGVALENARLVHETRQRNAELALINSVQAAIAGELDAQAIYELVGEQAARDLRRAGREHLGLRPGQRASRVPVCDRAGERLNEQPIPLIGFRKHVMETGNRCCSTRSRLRCRSVRQPAVLGGDPSKSALFVPLRVGGRATGVISLQNVDRTHAFDARR